jgi:hypothetical protein
MRRELTSLASGSISDPLARLSVRYRDLVVARDRIELPTRGFSVRERWF